jgi:uncharacterized membrane protein
MSPDPMGKLKDVGQDLVKNLGDKALDKANDTLDGLGERLTSIADGGGVVGQAAKKAGEEGTGGGSAVMGGLKGAASGIKDKVTGGGGGGGGGGGKATKATDIHEFIDVGVPISVAYNQWTEFDAFPSLMKKVEQAEAEEDNKVTWKAQVLWSHRTWEATIIEQIPEKRIVWRSSGEKGHVDGAVTFHELGPDLTRILVVLEYYPQGFFERTGNLWRAQGRRARLELKNFRRHVMTRTILDTDEVEGWRGTILDSEVEESHEDAVEREEEERDDEDTEDSGESEGTEESDEEPEDEPEDEYEESDEDEPDEDEPEDEYEEESEEEPEDEPEDEYEDEEPEDAADEDLDEDELEEEDPEEEEEDEPRPRRRRRSR